MSNEMKELYRALLCKEYNNNELWKYFGESNLKLRLTGSRAFKGNKYESSNSRMMVVGRAMNGWEADFSSCDSVNRVADCILWQQFNFDDVTNAEGFASANRARPYRYITSKFWKLIKSVLQEYGEANEHWYDKKVNLEWNQKIVWSNLYKVSPRESGNPSWSLMGDTLQEHIDLLKCEIEQCRPNRILFVTDINYLDPLDIRYGKREGRSFLSEFNIRMIDDQETEKYVVGKGGYKDIPIVVCKRPDMRGMNDCGILHMAKEIKRTFENM